LTTVSQAEASFTGNLPASEISNYHVYLSEAMLDRVDASHFSPLVGQTCEPKTATGEVLVLRVDTVKTKPLSRMPDAPEEQRVPFSVTLTALHPTAFVDGLCTLDLDNCGRLEGLRISRVAALGRDESQAYFQIIFN
jgi:hypothetical protein